MDEKTKLKYIYFNRWAHHGYDLVNKIRSNFYFNTIPLHQDEDFSPFFIVGSGRSGNTLLRRILTAKDGIVIPPETYVLGKIFRLHNVHKNLKWEDYVNLIISTFEYHPQFFTFEIESLDDLALELKELEADEQSLAEVINRFYTYYAEQKGLTFNRWGDKSPTNAFYVYRIRKLFPEAQFVHIVRDGIDVINSYVKADIYENYYKAALRWKGAVNFIRKFGEEYPNNYYELSYEDLVTNPKQEVQEVCKFLEINFNERMLGQGSNADNLGDVKYLGHHENVYNEINTNSIGKGRRKLSGEIDSKTAGLMNKTLESFNYNKV